MELNREKTKLYSDFKNKSNKYLMEEGFAAYLVLPFMSILIMCIGILTFGNGTDYLGFGLNEPGTALMWIGAFVTLIGLLLMVYVCSYQKNVKAQKLILYWLLDKAQRQKERIERLEENQ